AMAPTRPQLPLLQAVDLTKRYGEDCVLDRASFSARSTEVLGLIGPNGAGKTTLLEAIAALLPVDSGAVLWRGKTLAPAQRRASIFYLPDGIRPCHDPPVRTVPTLFPHLYPRH